MQPSPAAPHATTGVGVETLAVCLAVLESLVAARRSRSSAEGRGGVGVMLLVLRLVAGVPADDQHRAVRVGGDELAHRAEQHPRELTVATTADDDERSAPRLIDEDRAG